MSKLTATVYTAPTTSRIVFSGVTGLERLFIGTDDDIVAEGSPDRLRTLGLYDGENIAIPIGESFREKSLRVTLFGKQLVRSNVQIVQE
jgi:hypothetical protein